MSINNHMGSVQETEKNALHNKTNQEPKMSTNSIQSDWTNIKAKIKTKWDKFSDKEIDGFKDNLESLSTKIQSVYGYAKDQAEKEYKEFKTSIANFTSEKNPPRM